MAFSSTKLPPYQPQIGRAVKILIILNRDDINHNGGSDNGDNNDVVGDDANGVSFSNSRLTLEVCCQCKTKPLFSIISMKLNGISLS